MAGGKAPQHAADIINFVFNGTLIPAIPGTLYLSLATASTAGTDVQTTNECTWGGYARVAISTWSITAAIARPSATVTFASPTDTGSGSPETATHWILGTSATGAGKALYWGPISPAIVITVGTPPELITTSFVEET